MIYIVGYTFQFNSRPKPQTTGLSIQEQIVLSRRNIGQQQSSIFDTRFILGNTYKLSRIQKITDNSEQKVRYLFTNNTQRTLPDIDIVLPNTAAGDDYIAAISGQSQQLNDERRLIAAALDNASTL